MRSADVIIDHVGYVDAAGRRKLERNVRLLELDYAERAEDAFNLFNLGWTLLDLGKKAESLTHLQGAWRKRNRPPPRCVNCITCWSGLPPSGRRRKRCRCARKDWSVFRWMRRCCASKDYCNATRGISVLPRRAG